MNSKLYSCANNYTKALARLERNLESGRFASYTRQKKQQLWSRLCRYARQLGITIKAPLAMACLVAGLSFAMPGAAQPSFTQQTGGANPFNLVDVGTNAKPAFVDIDNDGDMDVFVGVNTGFTLYYENTGTALAPTFTQRIGVLNPLDGVDVGTYCAPTFVDIDGDGDKDVFIGDQSGNVTYYKNEGSILVPNFMLQAGALNPLNVQVASGEATPSFVDIDNDGDMDAFFGADFGAITYFENTGTVLVAAFTQRTGVLNPLDLANIDFGSALAFADLDNDGDKDVLIGRNYGDIRYFKNTGTALAPVFAEQSGLANPFDGVLFSFNAAPAFVNSDGDADMDVFIGGGNGNIAYYLNTTSTLPLHLVSFSGTKHTGYNQLQWQTADEVNTSRFEIERSTNGRNFASIASVNTTGNRNNNYSINDNLVFTGKMFYRLKMVDLDGRFTYSPIIWLNSVQAAGITIYPNPVKDILNVNMGNTTSVKTKASIYDANGRLMQDILINNNQVQIDVKQLVTGMYTIKFADGGVQKFMKE